MEWMISANAKMYDHASAFAKYGFIDWRKRANYSKGDIVYVYCTKPYQKVMYKCEVIIEDMPFEECQDDKEFWIIQEEYEKAKTGKYARLKLLEQVDSDYLRLNRLLQYGLKAAPQGPVKVEKVLSDYIDSYFNDFYTEGFFNDIDENSEYHEGHVRKVKVNKYERSSIARNMCIDYWGVKCLICGMDFEATYGEYGKGFIHVHHLRPLHMVKKDYIVDYKNDLIPVCPNCHAMIHRIPNGEQLAVEEIKQTLGLCIK